MVKLGALLGSTSTAGPRGCNLDRSTPSSAGIAVGLAIGATDRVVHQRTGTTCTTTTSSSSHVRQRIIQGGRGDNSTQLPNAEWACPNRHVFAVMVLLLVSPATNSYHWTHSGTIRDQQSMSLLDIELATHLHPWAAGRQQHLGHLSSQGRVPSWPAPRQRTSRGTHCGRFCHSCRTQR
jgi:hypothetical protein